MYSSPHPLVLHEIFKSKHTLPPFILCSLVNGDWNLVARSFVRDYRWFMFRLTKKFCTCTHISKLNQFCEKVVKCNRIVQFNTLDINISPFFRRTRPNYEHCIRDTRLTSSVKLRYLSIYCDPELKNLLRHNNAAELQLLTN